jgi:hypothetical protein
LKNGFGKPSGGDVVGFAAGGERPSPATSALN